MNYQETIQFLMDHLPMFQRIGPQAYKKDLTNIIKLCDALGNPQNNFSTIHIGGTNGKGSVSNLLASVLFEAGYDTGLYTSPHLIDFRERIRVNGIMCDKEFVVEFTKTIMPLIDEIHPSFFEITVAMAFAYFAEKKISVAVIEVGLGGRLDSTNIIQPDISVITNIGYDHMQLLGDTLPEIAFEKAGIIKPGRPVVIGEYHPETIGVFQEKAQSVMAPVFIAEENVAVQLVEGGTEKIMTNVSYHNQLVYPNLECALAGKFQMKNIATAIQAIELLNSCGYDISEDAVYDGFKNVIKNTGFAGRFQKISDTPPVYCDCAHNAEGLKELFNTVSGMSYQKLHIVTGAVNDKDINKNLACFPTEAQYYFAKPDIPRGMVAERIQGLASQFQLFGNRYDSVNLAYAAALTSAKNNDMVLICGSIFVVAEVLQVIFNKTIQTE